MAWRGQPDQAEGMRPVPDAENQLTDGCDRFLLYYTMTNIRKSSAGVPTLPTPWRPPAIPSQECKRWNGLSSN